MFGIRGVGVMFLTSFASARGSPVSRSVLDAVCMHVSEGSHRAEAEHTCDTLSAEFLSPESSPFREHDTSSLLMLLGVHQHSAVERLAQQASPSTRCHRCTIGPITD
jgi:hypothetical protein